MTDEIEIAVQIPEKLDITSARHARSYSIELSDASVAITRQCLDGAMAEMITRLYRDLSVRFVLPEIQQIFALDPQRKMAIRIAVQLIDEGASDKEIRRAAAIELQAFHEFVDRERPKLLASAIVEKPARPQ